VRIGNRGPDLLKFAVKRIEFSLCESADGAGRTIDVGDVGNAAMRDMPGGV
jgi:hypothetical protein